MFSGLDLIELTEVEEDGHTADGSPKHWHVFHLVARHRVVQPDAEPGVANQESHAPP